MRAGVQVSSDPPLYEFGEPTEWVLADRIVDIVPSPPRKHMHSVIICVRNNCNTLSYFLHTCMYDVFNSTATLPVRSKFTI